MEEIGRLVSELNSGDDERAEAAVGKLAEHGQAALAELQGLLESADADRRWWALRALAEIAAPETGGLLAAALNDPEPAVRQCAALGLRKQPDPEAIPALVERLTDPDALTAALAADALTELGEPAVPPLLAVLEKGPQPARVEAIRALAGIGDHRSIPALFKALDDESALIEHWANEGLERMGVGMSFFKPD